jgi:DNA invertase Pin-like site-specific DNA recombinase
MKKQAQCTKAVAYVRASTGRQIISPKDQRDKIEAYCTMAGLDLVEVIQEQGVSGGTKLAKRPEGARLDALLKAGVCHIIALKLDRLFRNAADALKCTEDWESQGIHLHLVDMGGMSLNTGSSMGRMLLTMLAGFAEFERALISERTTAALQYKRARGQVYSKSAPYGFDAVDGALIPNASEQRIVERMKAFRGEGESYASIANELNDESIPAKSGGLWHPFSIQSILAEAPRKRYRKGMQVSA